MSRQTRLPAIPTLTKDNIQQVVQAIKETLEVGERNRGRQIDGYVKFRDLVELDLAKESDAAAGGGGSKGPPVIAAPAFPDGYNPEADFSAPPVPTNLRADGAFSTVILTWDAATFRNYAYTEIWRSEEDALGNAARLGTSVGNVYADPAQEGKTYYYWVRFVSVANVVGPFNMTSGTVAKTAIKPERLLELLRGKITGEQLYSDLGNRIDLIDAPENFPGSVNGRLRDVVNQVSAKFKDVTAVIEQRFQITQNQTDGLNAQYTVKIDNNGYVAGFGLASSSRFDGPTTSSFAVRADEFYIANPAGPGIAPAMPFIVRTTPVTINGVLVPVGVYMTDAFIQNGTITNAKIANATIEDAKVANLSAAKLTVGDGTIGGVLKSANYVANTSGWIVRPDGTAEFLAAAIRGQLTASQIDARGLSILDPAGNVLLAAGGALTGAYNAPSSNMVRNPTAKLGNLYWSGGITPTQDVGDGGSYWYLQQTPSPGTIGQSTDFMVAAGGLNYTLAADVFALGVTSGLLVLDIEWWNNSTVLSYSSRILAINGQSWTRKSITALAPVGTTRCKVRVFLEAAVSTNSAVRKIKLERGTIATPFSDEATIGDQITSTNISTYIAAAAIAEAYIANAAITEAKIGTAAISNAKIKDVIQSNDYSAGSAGWKIDKFGEAEFNNVTVRGKLRAAQIYTGSQYLDRTSNLQVPTTGFGFYKPGTLNGTSVFTDVSMKFVGPSAHSGVDYLHRCRGRETALVNEVPFFITATADVDDYFSLWVRYDGGSWAFLISTRNQTGGYGPATFTYGLSVDFGVYTTVEFGIRCTDSAGNPFNGAAVDIQNMALCVQCFNL